MKRYILALTGASGIPYATSLFQALLDVPDSEVHVLISDAAVQVMRLETDCRPESFAEQGGYVYREQNLGAPMASGSWIHHGLVVCPCSMATLAAVSKGFGNNLIHRAADVTLKEKRPLILVPRETPLNQIHLQNMLEAARAGATILPACPGFYHRPRSIQDVLNHIVGRILDHLGINHELFPRWGEKSSD